MKPKYSCFVLLSFCVFGLKAQAVQDSLPDSQLRQLVITAQYAPTDVRQSVNTVRVLNQKTIESRSAVNLEELLQTESNIRLSQDAVLGSALSVNGLRGENVKILVDGVPVVGRLNGNVDAGQLPLGAVQQVEIIEGAQSLLYGSEASAGVVNLVTRKSQLHRFEAEANTQFESNGYRNLQGRVGMRMGKFLLQLTGNQLDFQPDVDTALGRDQLWNPKAQQAGRAMLRFSPSNKFDIRLSGGLFSEKVDNLGGLRRPQYKPYAFDDYYRTDRADATLHSEGWAKGRLYWQTTVGWNRFDRIKNTYRFDMEGGAKTLLEGEQDTSAAMGLLARFTLASDRRDRPWNFLIGLENYTEAAEGVRIVDTTLATPGRATGNDFALFASAKILFWKTLTLQGGARWTQNQIFGSAVTPSVWLLWQPSTRWQTRLSYANGFRSPGLKELYFNFIDINHYVVGSRDLRPEHSNNLRGEISWTSKDKSGNYTVGFTASGFYNVVRDRIILAEFAATLYRYSNLSRWETTGGGLGVNIAFNDWLRFRSEVVMTGFFNPYSEEIDSLNSLNWSPDWVNDLTMSFFNKRATCSVWHKRTGRTPFFFEENNKVVQGASEGWNMLNASVGGSFFNKSVRLNMGVKNIFNTRQIRSGATDVVGHSDGDFRQVHWGRTYFITAVFSAHSKS